MKLIKFFLLILLSFNISLKANSNDKAQNLLKEGGKLIFIRHAIAPGGGDPLDFDILRCETQRNLSKEGITQSKNIGKFFLKIIFKLIKCYLVSGVGVNKQQNMLLINMKQEVF